MRRGISMNWTLVFRGWSFFFDDHMIKGFGSFKLPTHWYAAVNNHRSRSEPKYHFARLATVISVWPWWHPYNIGCLNSHCDSYAPRVINYPSFNVVDILVAVSPALVPTPLNWERLHVHMKMGLPKVYFGTLCGPFHEFLFPVMTFYGTLSTLLVL